MIVYLLRHADALPGEPDALRLLSPKGHRQCELVGQALPPEIRKSVRACEHSPLLRAVATARGVQVAAKVRLPLKERRDLRPEDDPSLTARQLARSRGSRFLVGHNPHLAQLVGLLLGLRAGAAGIHFKKAALVALERQAGPTARRPYGTWRLQWMMPPPRVSADTPAS